MSLMMHFQAHCTQNSAIFVQKKNVVLLYTFFFSGKTVCPLDFICTRGLNESLTNNLMMLLVP